jgi:hypothetical protein
MAHKLPFREARVCEFAWRRLLVATRLVNITSPSIITVCDLNTKAFVAKHLDIRTAELTAWPPPSADDPTLTAHKNI